MPDPSDNPKAEDGIFSPPSPLPNPHDLSNGAHGNQLRFGVLDLTNTTTAKQWAQVLDWLASKGAPVRNYVFFTPILSGGFGSTMIVFVDELRQQSAHDATMLYNQPETALVALRVAYKLGKAGLYEPFPGFDTIDSQASDPVGAPMPERNTPGWARAFARYYDVSPNFHSGKVYKLGERYVRLATGEEFVLCQLIDGWRAGGAFGGTFNLRPAWERVS